MKRLTSLTALAATLCLTAAPVLAQSRADDARFQAAQQRFANELSIFRSEFDRYQSRANGPQRYPQGGPGYGSAQPRYEDDRVYRGNDGRYYCKRNDGTTGLIIGAAGGGILGNVIDGGRQRGAGTLIGGALGALLGRSVDQNNSQVKCR